MKDNPTKSKMILGMVMLPDLNSFDLNNFAHDFKSNYGNFIEDLTGDNSSATFRIEGEMVVIGHMPAPIPSGDIEGTAKYAYNWMSALEDTKGHKSHLFVSVLRGGQDQLRRFRLFTEVLCSLLRTTNAIGIYKGAQSLLIPKEDYLNEAQLMSDDYLPLNLWIYFGLRSHSTGNSGYTYGLTELNKDEMEIVHSARSLEDIRGLLFSMAHYVLEYDVTLEGGQTCGMSETEKIPISYSKGVHVQGDTLKLAF